MGPLEKLVRRVNSIWGRVNRHLILYKAFGSEIKSQPLFGDLTDLAGATILTDGGLRLVSHYLQDAEVLTGILWFQVTAGAYTADNFNGVGLYKVSSDYSTLTLVAQSANDGNIWKAVGGTVIKTPFTAQYKAKSGLYYTAALYNNSAQSTGPAPAGKSGVQSSGIALGADFTNGLKLSAALAGQASLPSSITSTDLTFTASQHYFALY